MAGSHPTGGVVAGVPTGLTSSFRSRELRASRAPSRPHLLVMLLRRGGAVHVMVIARVASRDMSASSAQGKTESGDIN